MSEFAQARRLMAEILTSDNELAEVYVANVAMYLFDKCDITDPKIFDDRARGILDLIFDTKLKTSTK